MAVAEAIRFRLENVLNFRDVGDFINRSDDSAQPNLRTGQLYRSARPDEASEQDRKTLAEDAGVKTVIDLRSDTEHINAAKKYRQQLSQAEIATVPLSSHATVEVPKIPGVQYKKINLNGKGFERALVWRLKYVSLARLILNMALGYRTEGIAVLGREVMQPRGLVGLGKDTLDYCGPEVRQVFDVLSNKDAYPVLVHCTQGKDRTGLVVLLTLLLCGVGLDAVTTDYVKSEPELEPEKEERMKEIRSIGLDESFAQCPPEFVRTMSEYLEAKYGGVERYLISIGINRDQQEQIRAVMRASHAQN